MAFTRTEDEGKQFINLPKKKQVYEAHLVVTEVDAFLQYVKDEEAKLALAEHGTFEEMPEELQDLYRPVLRRLKYSARIKGGEYDGAYAVRYVSPRVFPPDHDYYEKSLNSQWINTVNPDAVSEADLESDVKVLAHGVAKGDKWRNVLDDILEVIDGGEGDAEDDVPY